MCVCRSHPSIHFNKSINIIVSAAFKINQFTTLKPYWSQNNYICPIFRTNLHHSFFLVFFFSAQISTHTLSTWSVVYSQLIRVHFSHLVLEVNLNRHEEARVARFLHFVRRLLAYCRQTETKIQLTVESNTNNKKNSYTLQSFKMRSKTNYVTLFVHYSRGQLYTVLPRQ